MEADAARQTPGARGAQRAGGGADARRSGVWAAPCCGCEGVASRVHSGAWAGGRVGWGGRNPPRRAASASLACGCRSVRTSNQRVGDHDGGLVRVYGLGQSSQDLVLRGGELDAGVEFQGLAAPLHQLAALTRLRAPPAAPPARRRSRRHALVVRGAAGLQPAGPRPARVGTGPRRLPDVVRSRKHGLVAPRGRRSPGFGCQSRILRVRS